jgi:methylmalonyl-CoA epimerase
MLGITRSTYVGSDTGTASQAFYTPLRGNDVPNPLALDHVAIAVASLEDTIAFWGRLAGVEPTPIELVAAQGVRVTFLGEIELLEPTSSDSAVGRFLQKRGPGLHHVAYRTPDLASELARLKAYGYQLIDEEPRAGARGHRVAFVHPRATGGVLVELVERSG